MSAAFSFFHFFIEKRISIAIYYVFCYIQVTVHSVTSNISCSFVKLLRIVSKNRIIEKERLQKYIKGV